MYFNPCQYHGINSAHKIENQGKKNVYLPLLFTGHTSVIFFVTFAHVIIYHVSLAYMFCFRQQDLISDFVGHLLFSATQSPLYSTMLIGNGN
jgi:hypothetical protein